MNDAHNTRNPNNTGGHSSHDAEFDAQVEVMKTHNQSDATEVRDAKTRAKSVLNQAIAEETRRPSPMRKKPLIWVGGVAAAAAAVTVVAMNLPLGTEVELKPATPSVTSTPTTATPTTTAPTTATTAPTTPAETATATPTASAEKLKPAPTAPTTATTAITTANGVVDPFALVSVEQEIVFSYARDLVDGRCSRGSDRFPNLKSTRKMQLTPDEVRAMRSQVRLTALGDVTKKELQQISTAISALKEGSPYDPSVTYLGEAERWGVDCDGTGYIKLFVGSKGQGAAGSPPMPSGRTDALRPFVEAVQADPKVKSATKTFNQCYGKATQQDLSSESIGMYSFVKYSQDGSTPPKMRDVEQIWKCYEASGLQAASRQAQATWQKRNPAIVTKWKQDPAFYASKVTAAQKMIATEETKIGK